MFSLIITVVAIVLVAVLALATLYYGGASFGKGAARAEASKLMLQGQQLVGASDLFFTQNRRWPANIDELVNGGYLKQVPSAEVTGLNEALAAGTVWTMPLANTPMFVTGSMSSSEVCAEVNLSGSLRKKGILSHAYTNLVAQCYGASEPALKTVFKKAADTPMTGPDNTGLPGDDVVTGDPPTDPTDPDWFVPPDGTPPDDGSGGTGGGGTPTGPTTPDHTVSLPLGISVAYDDVSAPVNGPPVVQLFTVTNNGTDSVWVEIVDVDSNTEPYPYPWLIDWDGTYWVYLAPGQTDTITEVTFTPGSEVRTAYGTAWFSLYPDNGPSERWLEVPVAASTHTTPGVSAQPSVSSISFGTVPLGSASVRTFTLTNNGTAPFTVSKVQNDLNMQAWGTPEAEWEACLEANDWEYESCNIQPHTCTNVAVGSSCTVTVVFSPNCDDTKTYSYTSPYSMNGTCANIGQATSGNITVKIAGAESLVLPATGLGQDLGNPIVVTESQTLPYMYSWYIGGRGAATWYFFDELQWLATPSNWNVSPMNTVSSLTRTWTITNRGPVPMKRRPTNFLGWPGDISDPATMGEWEVLHTTCDAIIYPGQTCTTQARAVQMWPTQASWTANILYAPLEAEDNYTGWQYHYQGAPATTSTGNGCYSVGCGTSGANFIIEGPTYPGVASTAGHNAYFTYSDSCGAMTNFAAKNSCQTSALATQYSATCQIETVGNYNGTGGTKFRTRCTN